uniref:Uncharacterized protein n=1 Tax=Kalanchoe fedtschenkoi TaxID=63787 RepID=A0A7N0VC78_KALFE
MAASSLTLFTTLSIMAVLVKADPPGLILTIVNNCPFPIWPAIQPNAGHPVLESGGFFLPSLSHRSFPAPATPCEEPDHH